MSKSVATQLKNNCILSMKLDILSILLPLKYIITSLKKVLLRVYLCVCVLLVVICTGVRGRVCPCVRCIVCFVCVQTIYGHC